MEMEPQRPSHVIGTRMGERSWIYMEMERGEPSVVAG